MRSGFLNRIISFFDNDLGEFCVIGLSIVAAAGIIFSVDFSNNQELLQVMVCLIGALLAVVCFGSQKAWIPVLFGFLLIRDLSLGSVLNAGGVKIGDLFIFYLFLLWVLNILFNRLQPHILRSKLDFIILCFVVFYAFSLFWSSDFIFGLIRVIKFIRNFCFFILIRELFIKDFWDSYRKTTTCFILGGIILIIAYVAVIFQNVKIESIVALFHQKSLCSTDLLFLRKWTTSCGIFIAGPQFWLLLSSILTFGLLGITKSKFLRFAEVCLFLFMILGATFMTLNRSAMIMTCIIFLVLLIGSFKVGIKENKWILIGIVSLFALVVLVSGGHKLVIKRFSNPFKDGSWLGRVELASAAIKGFKQSPIIGIGSGSNFTMQSFYTTQQPSRLPDNLYLNILSETGLVGFGLFLTIVFLWLKNLFNCVLDVRMSPQVRSVSLVILAFSIGYLSIALIGQEFENFECWIMLGITAALIKIREKQLRTKEISYI